MEKEEEKESRRGLLAEAEFEEVVEKAELFLEKLQKFHTSLNTQFSVPCLNGTPLDLHTLFVEVTSRGGLAKVIKDRKWDDVVSAIKFEISGVRASFLLRKYYMSCLYHFEQAYLFGKGKLPVIPADAVAKIAVVGSAVDSSKSLDEASAFKLPSQENLQIEPGVSLVGVIDEKFDNGYVVSVNVGSDRLKGILYHIPDHPQPSKTANLGMPRRRKKKSRLSLLDPSKVKPSNDCYNFFPENYASVKFLSQGREDRASAE